MDAPRLLVRGEAAMLELGAQLAGLLPAGAVVYLHGDLGAGKTTLVRGLVQFLAPGTRVKSPTFTLVEPYESLPLPVYHFDLYRLADPEELEFMGIRDYFDGQSLVLVEWPQKGAPLLPAADLEIHIEHRGEAREVVFQTHDGALAAALAELCQRGTSE